MTDQRKHRINAYIVPGSAGVSQRRENVTRCLYCTAGYLLDLSVVEAECMKADDKLVHVLGGVVHVLRCQADCSRA